MSSPGDSPNRNLSDQTADLSDRQSDNENVSPAKSLVGGVGGGSQILGGVGGGSQTLGGYCGGSQTLSGSKPVSVTQSSVSLNRIPDGLPNAPARTGQDNIKGIGS